MKLVGAHALLGGAEEVGGGKPRGKGELGALEDGPDSDGELLAAVGAAKESLTGLLAFRAALALKPVVLADRAAVRADGTIGPANALKILASRVVVVEVGSIERGVGDVFFLLGQPFYLIELHL